MNHHMQSAALCTNKRENSKALSILENEAAFVQRGRKAHKRGHFMAM